MKAPTLSPLGTLRSSWASHTPDIDGLCVALLRNTAESLSRRQFVGSDIQWKQRDRRQAIWWVMNPVLPSAAGCLSLSQVCDHLGLDIEKTQRALLRFAPTWMWVKRQRGRFVQSQPAISRGPRRRLGHAAAC